MLNFIKISLLISCLGLMGFTVENGPKTSPSSSKVQDKIWGELTKCKVNLIEDKQNDVYNYGITYTPEVKAMAGKELTIDGFMMPIEASEKFQHFILAKRAPTCPFCPPGEPNEIVDVWTAEPIKWSEYPISVTGKFSLMEDKKLGMFFKLTDAKIFAPQPSRKKEEQFW